MKSATITLVSDEQHLPLQPITNEIVVPLSDLKQWVRSGAILRQIFRYRTARYITHDLRFSNLPFKMGVALRLLSRGACWFEDRERRRGYVTATYLLRRGIIWLREFISRPLFLRSIETQVEGLSQWSRSGRLRLTDLSFSPLYLRTDLDYGIISGGSLAHSAGIINSLGRFTTPPTFVTTRAIPMVKQDIETHLLLPEQRFWDFPELPKLYFNRTAMREVASLFARRSFSFIYHRYTAQSFVATELAARFGIPLVLEYNGSEIWVSRNWGTPLPYERLARRIENLMIHSAALCVVVSKPLGEELVTRGVDPRRVLVNPNGVDPDHYSPSVDGSEIRARHDLGDKCVIGFIGTFGKWHGVEKLTEAIAHLLKSRPESRDSVALLLVGHGLTMPEVRRVIELESLEDVCTLTGTVPQEQGAQYMAACDILVSPHVPNPDGSPFFGSPTKLFEYMAMEKPIVASALGQINDVLEHDRTALLVPPANPGELAVALERLLEDEDLRARLGKEARREAVSRYTWERHVDRIVTRVQELCG